MRHVAWMAGLLLAASRCALAAAPGASEDFSCSAWVDVDSSGHAHVVEMGSVSHLSDVPGLVPVADTIAARLRDRIETWRFVPATRDGAAVASRTWLVVRLEGHDTDGGGFEVRIRSASTGPRMNAGRPSDNAFKAVVAARSEGWMLVHVEYGSDGRVNGAHVSQSGEFDAASGRFRPRTMKALSRAAVETAKSAFQIQPELLDGAPVAGAFDTPMRFCISAGCMTAEIAELPDTRPGELTDALSVAKVETHVADTVL